MAGIAIIPSCSNISHAKLLSEIHVLLAIRGRNLIDRALLRLLPITSGINRIVAQSRQVILQTVTQID